METTSLIIRARIDEVTTIGQFTIDAYDRDITYFQAYKSSKYTPAFRTNLDTKKDHVEAIVNPKVLTGEMKLISERMVFTIIGLREPLNLLEGYVADAVGLTVGKKDFGISAVRKKINSGDVEGLGGALKTLGVNITSNMGALTAVGYTNVAFTALEATIQSIIDDKSAQNAKERARELLVVNNIGVINDFLVDIKAIWADGKRLFKISDKVRLKDYTNSDIIKRLRSDELHTLITGKVLNAAGVGLAGVKVSAKQSDGGKRGKTVMSKKDGSYEIRGLKPKTYLLTATLKNKAMFAVSATAVTNETVTVDLIEP